MNKTLSHLRIWKLAITKAGLLAFVAGATTMTTAMSGVKWESLDATDRVLLWLGVTVAIANSIVGFLDRTMERIEEGQSRIIGTPENIAAKGAAPIP